MTQKKLAHFFETLHAQTSIESFKEIYDSHVRFKDPFNEVEGIVGVYKVFTHMYENLENPKFKITEYIASNDIAYVKWDFMFSFKGEEKVNCFEGVSRLHINHHGKVIAHVDFWDAAEHMYEKMPILGAILRFIKRKIAIG